MEIFQNILSGFTITLTPFNLFMCLLGWFVRTLIGVLPGIGPAAAIALFLLVAFKLPPGTAIIMLSGIFYGAILVNIPGEAASALSLC